MPRDWTAQRAGDRNLDGSSPDTSCGRRLGRLRIECSPYLAGQVRRAAEAWERLRSAHGDLNLAELEQTIGGLLGSALQHLERT